MIVLYQKRIRKSSNFLKMISFDSQFSTCSVYCRHYFISYYEGKIILYTTATASRCTITSRIPASYMVSSGAQLIQYILQLYIYPIFAKRCFLTRTASHRPLARSGTYQKTLASKDEYAPFQPLCFLQVQKCNPFEVQTNIFK